MGSSLRGKKEDEWEEVMRRLETVLDRDIEDVVRVSYDSLYENEQILFLHIAVFFNYKDGDLVEAMFVDGDLDVTTGLKILVNRSLISIDHFSESIVMHKLLQQMARQAIHKQEPWKRQILMDAHEICDVLENETGTRNVVGISFDTSRISEVSISNRAFKRMPNLRFLKVCQIILDLSFSPKLKELPDLSKAENLKRLSLSHGVKLEVILSHLNMSSLEYVNMHGCSSLRNIPVMSKKIKELYISDTVVEDVPASSISLCSQLMSLDLRSNGKLKEITHLPISLTELNLGDSDIEKIPDGIKDLRWLRRLYISGCRRLASLPELPCELTILLADDCEFSTRVFFDVIECGAQFLKEECYETGSDQMFEDDSSDSSAD